ncbi:MAG: Rpn family recombination-promoting nuclease/putative transposase, partial [Chitinispirillales bacterium]|nr:Rpn family recombination-promoting nuclease/putative transposase [Chitinispirillales bacterium]
MNNDTRTNREYKDSVFTLLFSEKDKLIELCNAFLDTNYGPDTEVQITTLRNVLFMEQVNDISFVIDGKIVVLIEHQSTINENIPLRMLLYIARVYEKICENKNLYRINRIDIARPEFIVAYNGKDEYPDEQVLKLSDMFAECGEKNPIELELLVKVYNINNGRNVHIAQKSRTLSEYEIFIDTVRRYKEETNNLADAVTQAVKECIDKNILKTFLNNHGSEVTNMLLTEW